MQFISASVSVGHKAIFCLWLPLSIPFLLPHSSSFEYKTAQGPTSNFCPAFSSLIIHGKLYEAYGRPYCNMLCAIWTEEGVKVNKRG